MSLEIDVMSHLKEAMKAKNEAMLRGLRAIKAEIIKAKTEPGFSGELSSEAEIKLLQRLVKQRQDSLSIFQNQNRPDLALKEQEELDLINQFLPAQLNETEIKTVLQQLQTELGFIQKSDMGKLIGAANKKLAGKAAGNVIAQVAQSLF
ncbi:MAG: GatB/YqeY domain-containing protein [Sediminibacterium sp.]|nr:GatB/YqeY domain-containing protein [Sediminibacterium sp.]